MRTTLQSLKRTTAFRAVSRHGRWYRGALLSVGALPNGVAVTRVGIRTRRGLKGAVVRNRLKRQLRAILANEARRIRPGADIVIVLHPPTPSTSTTVLAQELIRLCERHRLIC